MLANNPIGRSVAVPIIEARKQPVASWLITHLLAGVGLRRMFGGVWLGGDRATIHALRSTPSAHRPPVIWAGTHPSWWDGYLGWLVNARLGGRDAYLMMDAEFLPRYRFFTRAGAFGVDRKDPRAALESVEYAAQLLVAQPNRALWIMPQGTITPPERRPLVLYGGVGHIVRRLPEAWVVPIAWRLVFRGEQRPDAIIHIAPRQVYTAATTPPSRVFTAGLTAMLTAADDAIAQAIRDDDLGDYRLLLRGGTSINRRWDNVRAAVGQRIGRKG